MFWDPIMRQVLCTMFKSGIGDTQGIIYPDANLISSCIPVNPNKLCAFKIPLWTGVAQTFPIQKREIWKKKEVMGSK